jgi:phosphoesterase RecJ-like protein
MVYTKEKLALLDLQLKAAKSIVITAHKSPDGDSIGSSLALYHYLNQFHSNITIVHPDKAPHFLEWMPGINSILTFDENEAIVVQAMQNADLIFCLDYNATGRIGKVDAYLEASSAFKIMIDHHRDPDEGMVDLVFSDKNVCSTCQLIFDLIDARGDLQLISDQLASCIYTGIITDSGSFRFSSVTPRTHEIAGYLIKNGLNHSVIHENLYDTNTENRIKLTSFALLEKLVVLPTLQTGYLSLTRGEQERFSPMKGDTEGLVNQVLSLKSVKLAVFFHESDGLIKISFRSNGTIPANDLARTHFGGGGHLNAAGGKFVGKIEEAIAKFVTILPKFVEDNKVHFE